MRALVSDKMAKLLISWNNYSCCKDFAFHFQRDVKKSIYYIIAGVFVYLNLASLRENQQRMPFSRSGRRGMKICESKFASCSSTKAKDLVKVVSEAEQAELCRQRERIREEIAMLQIKQNKLAEKVIDNDNRKRKLIKKRIRLKRSCMSTK